MNAVSAYGSLPTYDASGREDMGNVLAVIPKERPRLWLERLGAVEVIVKVWSRLRRQDRR